MSFVVGGVEEGLKWPSLLEEDMVRGREGNGEVVSYSCSML